MNHPTPNEFDYHDFLLKVKLYTFDTIATVVVLSYFIYFAIKELWPLYHEAVRLILTG